METEYTNENYVGRLFNQEIKEWTEYVIHHMNSPAGGHIFKIRDAVGKMRHEQRGMDYGDVLQKALIEWEKKHE